MEDLLKFENRERMFKFLMDEFGLNKVQEQYFPKNFGNFFIKLAAKNFLLRYVNDRSFLTIEIASQIESDKWYDLSYVKDFIYNKYKINADDRNLDNYSRIEELNNFLKKDFDRISDLFSKEKYPSTKRQIDELLKKQFKRNFPGW